ncbi:MAG: TolC family protein [Breznakibacter sp.]
MKTMITKILIAAFVAFGLLPNANGQPADSLAHYLEEAARNNPLVMQRYFEYQAALQKVPQVGSLPDPELSAGIFLSPMELLGGNQVADLRLMQMFPWFGVLKSAKDEMALMAKAKHESLREAKLQLFFDVQRTWFEMLRINEDIHIAERNMELLQTLERLTLERYKASGNGATPMASGSPAGGTSSPVTGMGGMASMGGSQAPAQVPAPATPPMSGGSMGASAATNGLAELYRLQIEMAETGNRTALLRSRQKTVAARFNSYLNRTPESPLSLPDSLTAMVPGFVPEALQDSMLTNHPMLRMLDYEQQSADARKKMSTRMGYPMIGVGVNYSVINKSDMAMSSMNGKDMVMPMVSVSLPIYRKKYKAMQAEADLTKTATQQNYQNTSNALQTEYYQALELFDDAGRRMALYRKQSELANQTSSIMTKSFSASGTGLTDVLLIRQQLLDYDTKLAEAIADYNTAVAWLMKLSAQEETTGAK